ncbi:GtrA family protein [Clostridium tagluense]|uniref:GtrA family protein n=1 Tax=Clostridium tagluense TaxID=360422 RepID=UPI001C6EA78C|nr:GtrA family protein [Clostridium tagluense]MBW9157001.1 GtrA family protein [Clostridium tagluense]WLC64988.1 GtrA family protein [Clostridium tagluense]
MYQKILQFIKFGFVGASNTLISFIIYYALVYLNVNYIIANVVGYIISSVWGYILNKKWVFKESTEKTSKSVIKYYIVYGSSFFINILCMYIFVDALNISKIIAPILTIAITVSYNFIFNKVWAFNNA